MPPFSLADPPVLAFLVLPAAVAILLVWGTAAAWRRSGAASAGLAAMKAAAGALIWMGVTLALADRGTFRRWDATPPPFALLVGRGIMPQQMSYSGRNFDVLTGTTAIVVAGLVAARVAGRRLVMAWNSAGLLLLVNIVTVAILSTPRFAAFGPDHLNVFVTYAPFVWLPAVLVLAALAGHLIVFRALRRA